MTAPVVPPREPLPPEIQKALNQKRQDAENAREWWTAAAMAAFLALFLLFVPKACGDPRGGYYESEDWCDRNNCH
jgi:hypothetical protein